MTYYQYIVLNTDRKWCIINTQFPIHFYELKYDFTIYKQFFYDDLVPTMLPCTIYSHTISPAPTLWISKGQGKLLRNQGKRRKKRYVPWAKFC